MNETRHPIGRTAKYFISLIGQRSDPSNHHIWALCGHRVVMWALDGAWVYHVGNMWV